MYTDGERVPQSRQSLDKEYALAMNEYSWSRLPKSEFDRFDHFIDEVASRFPNGEINHFKTAMMEQIRNHYIKNGSFDTDGWLKGFDVSMDMVYDPPTVCRHCGWKRGPKVKDFVNASSSPMYLKDGGVSFPYKLKGVDAIGYMGEVIVYSDRLVVYSKLFNVNNGQTCAQNTRVNYIFRKV